MELAPGALHGLAAGERVHEPGWMCVLACLSDAIARVRVSLAQATVVSVSASAIAAATRSGAAFLVLL